MLYLIIGRKGAGKTHYAHRLLGDWVRTQHRQGVLLVPRQFTFESDKGVLETLGPRDACEVEVLSFSRLADVVFKTCGGPKQPILRDGANAAMLALALNGVGGELHFFARHRANAGFIRKMLAQIASFKQSRVSPDDLSAAAQALPDGYLKDKLSETALIYRAYDALVGERFFDDGDVLTAVAEKLRGATLFKDKLVVIDDFSAFTNQEYTLIEQMLLQAKDVYVTLCTDNIDDRSTASPFALTNHTARFLRRLCGKTGVPFGGVIVRTAENCGYEIYQSAALRHLETNLFLPKLQSFDGATDDLTFCTAPSVREECDNAAMEIRRLLREKQYRCRDIAVVFRNPEPYAKYMKYSLKKCGVPVFEDLRAPIENEPLVILVRALLELCRTGFTTENLMRYLKTGLSGLTWDEIADAENYALLWDLSSKGWQQPWTDNPDGFGVELDDSRRERLRALNEIRERIVLPLQTLREEIRGKNARDVMGALYAFLRDRGVDEALKEYALTLEAQGKLELALEQGQIWDLLMVSFDAIAQTAGDSVLPLQLLTELFDLAVGAQSLGKLPDGFDEVYLCEAARIATQMPKVIFALGMNAGVFPQSPASDGLLSRGECDLLRQSLPQLPDEGAQTTMTERFYIYNTLCSAREKLYVSCAQTGKSGEKLTESEIVLLLQRMFPQAKNRDYGTLPPEAFTEGEDVAFAYLAAHWKQTDPKTEAFRAFFASQDAYRDRLHAIARAAKKETFRLKDKDTAKALFGEKIVLSASQLEKYEECPFEYFCRYGLRAKPRQIAKLDPASAGTVVHYVLEQLLKSCPDGNIAAIPREETHQKIASVLQSYIETYMGGAAGKSARFLYLYRRMYQTLVTLMDRLLFEFSQSSFVPVGFEVPIGPGKPIKPFRIALEDGYVELRGVVDRVDEMKTNDKRYIRVVDYKTGTKEFSLSDVLQGLGMQMLLYLVSIWRSETDVTPAGVLYMPARFEPFGADRDDTAEKKDEQRIVTGKMDGMILDDGEVLKGMDHSLQGALLPMKINKRTNAVSGQFISLTQLGLLAKRMDKILKKMGDDLHGGKVEAKPVYGKNHAYTCDWCDYRSVCGREADGVYRYLVKRTHSEALTALEEEESTDGT